MSPGIPAEWDGRCPASPPSRRWDGRTLCPAAPGIPEASSRPSRPAGRLWWAGCSGSGKRYRLRSLGISGKASPGTLAPPLCARTSRGGWRCPSPRERRPALWNTGCCPCCPGSCPYCRGRTNPPPPPGGRGLSAFRRNSTIHRAPRPIRRPCPCRPRCRTSARPAPCHRKSRHWADASSPALCSGGNRIPASSRQGPPRRLRRTRCRTALRTG